MSQKKDNLAKMGQPSRISLGQAVTPRGLAVRPGYDRVTGPGSVTGLGLSRDRSGPGSVIVMPQDKSVMCIFKIKSDNI